MSKSTAAKSKPKKATTKKTKSKPKLRLTHPAHSKSKGKKTTAKAKVAQGAKAMKTEPVPAKAAPAPRASAPRPRRLRVRTPSLADSNPGAAMRRNGRVLMQVWVDSRVKQAYVDRAQEKGLRESDVIRDVVGAHAEKWAGVAAGSLRKLVPVEIRKRVSGREKADGKGSETGSSSRRTGANREQVRETEEDVESGGGQKDWGIEEGPEPEE